MEKIAATIDKNSLYLSELDSLVGDGDHGTTIPRGFSEVIKKIEEKSPDNISDLLKTTGFTLIYPLRI